ncbi:hypothetical protein BJ138DRAFT_1083544 [Hygrophoropsis aurantiaca]|uniref:Uncharacterized protein n=1 Tax=Hygrophoropsis aurantiaca TaxID=72124 RepID=A0ACB8AGR5_9AGAM|nr:hypothetical protein BJ138DRAFT_1083544 [Hygrophoropsis aurantiaca]
MVGRAILLALLPVAGVLGFSDSIPIVAWASQSSDVLDVLPAEYTSVDSASLLRNVFSQSSICSYDAVVVIDHPGLHSSDLRTLSQTSSLARLIGDAPLSRQLPHVKRGSPHLVADFTQLVSNRCGSHLVNINPVEDSVTVNKDSKHVFCMTMPSMDGSDHHRKNIMAEHESRLSSELEKIVANFANHLVVYSGSPLALSRRAESSEFDSAPSPGSFDSTLAEEGGIFKRYQLFTTPLIVGLLITFFLLVPIVLMGVTALASIQSSLSSDIPRGYNAQEKKVQ